MLTAKFDGATCTMQGVWAVGKSPILALCRKLVVAGLGGESMVVYRDGKPVVMVPNVAVAAGLSVAEGDGKPRFTKYSPFPDARDDRW